MGKEELFSKLNVKDYNNELEKVLERKSFSGDTKNLLLSMLYKAEIAYEDYFTVKRHAPNKNEYVKRIVDIVKSDCDEIILIKPLSQDSDELENKQVNYVVNQKQKQIKTYPNDRYLLYSLFQIERKEVDILKKYTIISKSLKEFLKIASILNNVEVIRDFNGWSWSVISKEIGEIEYNLLYQNLLILFDSEFLEKWIVEQNEESDFIVEFEKLFENEYGKELKDKFISLFYHILILIHILRKEENRKQLLEKKEAIEAELEKLTNKEIFLEKIAQDKKKYHKEIKKIEDIVADEKKLQKELERINQKLPQGKKVFSTNHLECILNKSKIETLSKIDQINYIMDPKNYVSKISDLKADLEVLKLSNIDIRNADEVELDEYMINIQKVFLDCFDVKIKKAQTKREFVDLVYNLRYYNLLPYQNETIGQNEDVKKAIKVIGKELINKACEQKVITIINSSKSLNYKIISEIFSLRIIRLETIFLKIKVHADLLEIEIYDDEILEKKVEFKLTQTEKDFMNKFLIKLKKKNKLFI